MIIKRNSAIMKMTEDVVDSAQEDILLDELVDELLRSSISEEIGIAYHTIAAVIEEDILEITFAMVENHAYQRRQEQSATKIQTGYRRWICMQSYQAELQRLAIIAIQKEEEELANYCIDSFLLPAIVEEEHQRLLMTGIDEEIITCKLFISEVIDEMITTTEVKIAQAELYRVQTLQAIKIQAIYRQYRAYSSYRTTIQAVIKIQASYRRYHQHRQWVCFLLSVEIIQSSYRRKKIMQHYKLTQQKATIISQYYRRYSQRKNFLVKKRACITLQASYRKYCQVKAYQQMKQRVLILQCQWRCHQAKYILQQKRQGKASQIICAFIFHHYERCQQNVALMEAKKARRALQHDKI